MLQKLYRGATCNIYHNGVTSNPLNITSGVRQGCVLSPLLFIILIDAILPKVNDRTRGIQWTLQSFLTELDYADDIYLLVHTFSDMQEQLNILAEESRKCGMNSDETKSMRINNNNNTLFFINGTNIEEVDEFTYLGSIISKVGGADADVKSRIKKAQQAFGQLRPIWSSRLISTSTKLRIFNSNVKSVLLYGSETWKVTKDVTSKLQVFVNRCLRRILRIYWPEIISNEQLLHRTNQRQINKEILNRKWGWIGHILRKPTSNIARAALDWNPQGKRRPERPNTTWRRSTISDLKTVGTTWTEAKHIAHNRTRWKALIGALCSV